MDVLKALYQVVEQRKANPAEGSYTCYLLQQGLDKILKKVGEESAEVIIAAKNGESAAIVEELCDLYYHLAVLMVKSGVSADEVAEKLAERNLVQGNLKTMKKTDKNT